MIETVKQTKQRSGWPIRRTLSVLGISSAVYYAWLIRNDRLVDAKPPGQVLDKALPDEVEAVVAFARAHPQDGYRPLAYMMVDEDVAYLSPSSVYRILSARDLLCRWKPPERAGHKPEPPTRPHEVWHTDLMYLWVRGRWYFLVTVLDGYSRYIVHWALLSTMLAGEVTDVVAAALAKFPDERPKIVHDRGSQFTGKEFRKLTRRFDLVDIPTRLAHPQSNGKQERFFRTLRHEALSAADLGDYDQAVALIGEWVEYYNHQRLHSALGYLAPVEYLRGDPQAKQAKRREKLAQAAQLRRERNRAAWQENREKAEGLGLSHSAQRKPLAGERPGGADGDQAACVVPPLGARVAPQQSPILQRGD